MAKIYAKAASICFFIIIFNFYFYFIFYSLYSQHKNEEFILKLKWVQSRQQALCHANWSIYF